MNTSNSPASTESDVAAALANAPTDHPRLFWPAGGEEAVRAKLTADPLLEELYQAILREAEAILATEPVTRELTGRRLLSQSRTCLGRVVYLAFAYRMTGRPELLERAQGEMLAAASFEDWNPRHFLDVAEMTTALAIGYDWLYEDLDPEVRTIIRQAIIDKGLRPGLEQKGGWVNGVSNWTQVCHGGMVLGALAVHEHEPQLARRTLVRAVENLPRAMRAYSAEGAYPEGPTYWGYGTSYNVLLIEAMRSGLGTDFGLASIEPFRRSAEYLLHVTGPTGLYFNYADSGQRGLEPAVFWFAAEQDQPGLLWWQREALRAYTERTGRRGPGNRLLPLLLLWAKPVEGPIQPPQRRHYVAGPPVPIGLHRSDWDERTTFVGIKAGSPSYHHGHMDIGSFVLDAHGVRWAIDLGAPAYHPIEAAGLNLWDMRQQGDRWRIFRISNLSHNTLVVDSQFQRAAGFAPIVGFSDDPAWPHTIVDMSDVYGGELQGYQRDVALEMGATDPVRVGQLARARRGIALLNGVGVVVQDEIETLGHRGDTQVRWAMLTAADVQITAPDAAVLTQEGERLTLRVLEPEGVQLEVYQTEPPPSEHDQPNPGTRMVGFTVHLPQVSQHRLEVLLTPGAPHGAPPVVKPLDEW